MPDARTELLPKVLIGNPYLSIVILTDQSTPEIEKEGKLLSAHYLVEPVAPERLLDCVGLIMGKKSILNNTDLSTSPINSGEKHLSA
ncbi:MAG: hypothetical protein A2029_06010 [Chloroflexi bacterium RBG_19FT_COMBO_47_9]|nr:MAG: hypothetical protein A2029_06010 [Chloroflexi bacterium RBG_19FT_COMBO_47_9]